MATLTKSTGTVTLSGTAEKVTLPAVYGWVWVKNMSDSDMFVGLSESVSAGADGVLSIPSGDAGRIQTDGQDSVYLIGSGNALVVAQNYADCPFKVGGKGGESPDLSAYAKTADVPNIKVNSAGNADTVSSLRHNEYYIDIFSTSLTSEHPCWNKICYVFGQSTDSSAESFVDNAPEISIALWYEVETIGNESRAYQIAHGCYIHQRKSFIRYMHDAVWSDWFEIYTSKTKPYISGSATVAANNTTCVSNHGFTPSAVIWWDGSLSGVAVSFSDTQFTFDKTSSVDRTVNYLIFK